MIEWFEGKPKAYWNPKVAIPGDDGMLAAIQAANKPTEYVLRWDWCVEKGRMVDIPGCHFLNTGIRAPHTFSFHPDDFVHFIQRNFGSDVALDALKHIIHETIDARFNAIRS